MEINKAGVDWLLTKTWLLDQRDAAMQRLLSPTQPEALTNFNRGRIAVIDELIEAVEAERAPEGEVVKDYV